MTTTTHACDLCGQVIVADRTLLLVVSGPLPRGTEFDLCADCLRKFQSWLRDGQAQAPKGPS